MEDYFRRVPGTLNLTDWNLNHDHNSENAYLPITQNRTRAAEIILSMISNLPEVMDINPAKAMRGLLSYLMPRIGDLFGSMLGGGSSGSGTADMLGSIATLLREAGLTDIIFEDKTKINNIAFNISIQNTYLNITLNGGKLLNMELDGILIPINVSSMSQSLSGGDDSSSEDSGSSLPISLPVDFASPFPYIEISTFNGPYDVEFQTLFANGTIVPNQKYRMQKCNTGKIQ
jgi:hypothetical protein